MRAGKRAPSVTHARLPLGALILLLRRELTRVGAGVCWRRVGNRRGRTSGARMAGTRAPSAIGAALAAVWLVTVPASGSGALSLSGVARDSVGNLLADVRVLIL